MKNNFEKYHRLDSSCEIAIFILLF